MLPLHDDNPSQGTPYVTYALILANVLVFLYELSLGDLGLERFFQAYAVIPHDVSGGITALEHGHAAAIGSFVPILTAMFMHAGWMHLLGNMLFLYIFGDNVEERLGHLPYLAFYLFAGLAASLAHIWSSPLSQLPSLGASGAIGGVLGAYLVLYPGARVLTLIFLGFFTTTTRIPAMLFLGVWFVMQSIQGLASLGVATTGTTGGTAWWAHIGGFVVGAAVGGVAKMLPAKGRSPHADRWYSNR